MSLIRKRYRSQLPEESDSSIKRQVVRYDVIAKLYSIEQGKSHIIIPRKPSGVLVGRSSTCDIKLTGGDVSSKHCQFSLTFNNENEFLCITDMSSNGVYVNEEKLGRGSTKLLKSGDKVSFAKTGGSFIFRYTIDEANEGEKKRKSFYDDYILGNQLGSGHYAIVKEARNRTTGDIVAVKIFNINKTNTKNDEAKLQQEMNLLLSVDHPNIVKFIGRYVEPLNEYASSTFLVLEKMNSGELFQRIINKSKLRQDETKEFFKQILSGLNYLHKNSIIHRDIKPENILLDVVPRSSQEQEQTGPWDEHEYDIKVKIADFGLAKFIGELKFTNTLCGTPAYVAPEILGNSRNYSTKVDLWSSGVLLYVCLCGFPPFSDELAPPSMKEQILEGKYAFYSPYWDDIEDSALDLISNLLVVDPADRFDISQTCQHYWFHEDDQRPSMTIDSMPSEEPHQRSMLRSNTTPLSLRDKFTSELNFGSDRSSVI